MRCKPRIVTIPCQPVLERERPAIQRGTTAFPVRDALIELNDQRFIAIQFGDGNILSVSAALIERAYGIPLSQWIADGIECGEIERSLGGARYPTGDASAIFFELQCSLLSAEGMLKG